MKAARHTEYGPPEVVKIQEVEKPQPADHDVLIKVLTSTVNRVGCGFRSAEYLNRKRINRVKTNKNGKKHS